MKVVTSISIEKSLRDRAQKHAKREDLSLSWIVSRALTEYLDVVPEKPRRRIVGRTA